MIDNPLIRIAIFASGKGSNARKIIEYIGSLPLTAGIKRIEISLIVTNKADAGVLAIADEYAIPHLLLDRERFFNTAFFTGALKDRRIDYIVLAGFLWKIPAGLIRAFPDRILNIHPALLPAYGGKGMYGRHVHEAVIAAKEKESGISIHYVDELYDHGRIFFQATCTVDPGETPDSLANKIHALEHRYYPETIRRWIETK